MRAYGANVCKFSVCAVDQSNVEVVAAASLERLHWRTATEFDERNGDANFACSLLQAFRPLCVRCSLQAVALLPHEERNVLLCEVECEFFLLLHEFDASRGVDFAGFIARMLPLRVLAWARREQLHAFCEENCRNEEIKDCCSSEGAWCTECDEPQRVVERQLWWQQMQHELTARERQAMHLLLDDFTEREIARQLKISQPRVHLLISNARKKLQPLW